MGQIINNVIISLVLLPVVYYLAKKRKGNEWIWVGVTFLVSSFIGFWVNLIPIVYLLFCENKEIKILRGQAKQGDTDAQYNLGVFLLSKNSYEEAKNWFDKAATQGHTDAQSKSDECEKIIAEKKAEEERIAAEKAAEKERERAYEASLPRCAYSGCPNPRLPLDRRRIEKYGAVAETPYGTRFYCSRWCKSRDGYGEMYG